MSDGTHDHFLFRQIYAQSEKDRLFHTRKLQKFQVLSIIYDRDY